MAISMVAISFLFQAHIDFNFSDEGFLWYGAIHVRQGETPIVDFQAYDPGRYYWLAVFSFLFGNGIIALRAGAAVFQVVGLGCGLLAARRAVTSCWGLALCGVLLLCWMVPRHKVFESAMAMIAVWVVTRLLEVPSTGRVFQGGVVVGLGACIGRNHGLYILAACFGAILLISFGKRGGCVRRFQFLGLGVMAGLSPLVVLIVARPQYLSSVFESISLMQQRGQLNLPLPIPWPWTVQLHPSYVLLNCHRLAVGCGFVVLLGVLTYSTLRILRHRETVISESPLLVAATFVGIAYAHHASVRSDMSHLAQAIHPTLLAMFALAAGKRGATRRVALTTTGIVLGALTALGPGYLQPWTTKARSQKRYVLREISGDRVWLRSRDATLVDAVRSEIEPDLHGDELVFVAPSEPGLYVILGRSSPVWDLYPIWPAPRASEIKMIDGIRDQGVRWAIVNDKKIDGKEELRFRNTHPLVWQFLNADFEKVTPHAFPPGFHLFKRNDGVEPFQLSGEIGLRTRPAPTEKRSSDVSQHS